MAGMVPIEQFEIDVAQKLTERILPPGALDAAIREGEFVSYDYTGYGYYFTFRHPQLPSARFTCDKPYVTGESNGIGAGFLVFLGENELTIECYPLHPDRC